MNKSGDISQHVPKQYAIIFLVWWSLKRLHVRYREDERKLKKNMSQKLKACDQAYLRPAKRDSYSKY